MISGPLEQQHCYTPVFRELCKVSINMGGIDGEGRNGKGWKWAICRSLLIIHATDKSPTPKAMKSLEIHGMAWGD